MTTFQPMSNDPRVDAIRNDPKVGSGSCSPIDECYEDSELIERLDAAGASTPKAALKWAHALQDVFDDRMADAKNSAF